MNIIIRKALFFLFSVSCNYSAFAFEISPEFYCLGFSGENEKEIGCNCPPSESLLQIWIEEKDSLEMDYLTDISSLKFKRNKYIEDCSNCHLSFTSKNVNKNWVMGKYFEYTRTTHYSLTQTQWYQPHFKSEFILMATEIEKLSFIAGLFLRSGKIDSLGLNLTIDESPEKAICIFKLLELLGCNDVIIDIQNNVLNDGFILNQRAIISFKPNEEIKNFLKREIEIKNHQNAN